MGDGEVSNKIEQEQEFLPRQLRTDAHALWAGGAANYTPEGLALLVERLRTAANALDQARAIREQNERLKADLEGAHDSRASMAQEIATLRRTAAARLAAGAEPEGWLVQEHYPDGARSHKVAVWTEAEAEAYQGLRPGIRVTPLYAAQPTGATSLDCGWESCDFPLTPCNAGCTNPAECPRRTERETAVTAAHGGGRRRAPPSSPVSGEPQAEDCALARADRVFRYRVMGWMARAFGLEMEHPACPEVLRAAVHEHTAVEEGEDFDAIRGTVDALLEKVEPAAESSALLGVIAKCSRIIAGLDREHFHPEPYRRLAAVQDVLMPVVRAGWERKDPIFTTRTTEEKP